MARMVVHAGATREPGLQHSLIQSEVSYQARVPDFQIDATSGTCFVEVTEATLEADRRAMNAQRRAPGKVFLLGEPVKAADGSTVPGGRFRGGAQGHDYELAMAHDIRQAIVRKSDRYRGRIFLLVYPNSNASLAVRHFVDDLLRRDLPVHSFEAVYVLHRRGGITVLS